MNPVVSIRPVVAARIAKLDAGEFANLAIVRHVTRCVARFETVRLALSVGVAAVLAVGWTATPADAQATAAESAVEVNGIVLRYAVTGPEDGAPLLLIAGTGMQLTQWPEAFVSGLVERGFRVITFDNRDIGLSTHFDAAGPPDWAAIFGALAAGTAPELPYTMDDMANDVVGLLDALSLERVHLYGGSMGATIAQIVAATHPERTLSLTLAMATSGNPAIRIPADPARMAAVPPPAPTSDTAAWIARQVAGWKALASPTRAVDEDEVRARVVAAISRAYDPAGYQRQGAAALVAGDRREQLRSIRAPTVVVHGADDPLIPVDAGREVASLIPDAEFRIIPGMGHDMPDAVVPQIVDAVTSAAARAARVGQRD